MPETLRRVNPILSDVLDSRGWDERNPGGRARRQRGGRRNIEEGATAAEDPQDAVEAPPNLIDVRI